MPKVSLKHKQEQEATSEHSSEVKEESRIAESMGTKTPLTPKQTSRAFEIPTEKHKGLY